jgi:serine/threonine protein kinase
MRSIAGRSIAGRYVIESRIGEGGMGQVFKVRHAQLGKLFALKVISPAFANDVAARERFNQEARIASEITHPNIVSVVDYGEDRDLGAYMVMELVEGDSLLIADHSAPMSPRRVLDVLGQVADALDHLHSRGLVHGDVKAENIILAAEPDPEGVRRRRVVRLLDFGLARRHGVAEDGVSGSPHYLAPERAAGAPASVATDIYALGVLGFVLFTRTFPFDGEVLEILTAHVHEIAPSLSDVRGEPVDDAIEQLISRAMAKNPADRHPTAARFRYELNAVIDMLGLARRRSRPSLGRDFERDRMLAMAFDASTVAQALVIDDGTLVHANHAFAAMTGAEPPCALPDLPFAQQIPNLMRTIRRTHIDGRSFGLRYSVEAEQFELWTVPMVIGGDHYIQLLLRRV